MITSNKKVFACFSKLATVFWTDRVFRLDGKIILGIETRQNSRLFLHKSNRINV